MFRTPHREARPSFSEVAKTMLEAIREGQFRDGERFPNPDEIAQLTGATLVDSLQVVSTLLSDRTIMQDFSGRLFVSQRNG